MKISIEAHIEQGPVLEAEGIDIGVVESVQGISWTEIEITGVSNHAGTTQNLKQRSKAADAFRAGSRRNAHQGGG